MNIDNPFETIGEFCRNEDINNAIESILFHKYQEEINELTQSYREENNGTEPPADTVSGFKQTLLSENSLSTNVRLAEEEIELVLGEKIKAEKRKLGRTSFWKSVLSSVLGSFIFVVLLILLFIVAENQIKGLLGVGTSVGEPNRTEQSNDSK